MIASDEQNVSPMLSRLTLTLRHPNLIRNMSTCVTLPCITSIQVRGKLIYFCDVQDSQLLLNTPGFNKQEDILDLAEIGDWIRVTAEDLSRSRVHNAQLTHTLRQQFERDFKTEAITSSLKLYVRPASYVRTDGGVRQGVDVRTDGDVRQGGDVRTYGDVRQIGDVSQGGDLTTFGEGLITSSFWRLHALAGDFLVGVTGDSDS